MSEIRNELLRILTINKAKTQEDRKLYTTWLLESFENDIKKQLKDLKTKQIELEENLETLNYVKKQLEIEN
jgi:hypothetical protein